MKVNVRNLFVDVRKVAVGILCLLLVGFVTVSCEKQNVSSVSLNEKNLSLFVGRGHQITVTVSPNDAVYKTVRWISSNPSVVSVTQGGWITGVSEGTATITATVVNTNGDNKTEECIVTVKRSVANVRFINLTTDVDIIYLLNVGTIDSTTNIDSIIQSGTGVIAEYNGKDTSQYFEIPPGTYMSMYIRSPFSTGGIDSYQTGRKYSIEAWSDGETLNTTVIYDGEF